jgi:hypothetical protein
VLLRAEPTKQKTRRPERRGIARAVSPKKMREEKKEMSSLRIVGEEDTDRGSIAGSMIRDHRSAGSRR